MADPTQEQHGPLRGYRVLDFGWVLAGAVPGTILADMGAEVIKVETRQHMDYMRLGRSIRPLNLASRVISVRPVTVVVPNE